MKIQATSLFRSVVPIAFLLSACSSSTPLPPTPAPTASLTVQGESGKATDTPGASAGGIRISKYPGDYTSFRLEAPGGPVIITDPYNVGKDTRADVVTESHDHYDHSDTRNILQPYRLITTTGSFEVGGVKITGVAGRHNRGDTGPTNVIYVFDWGDIRLAQFASQGDVLSEDTLARIGHADVFIAQLCGGGSKLSLEEVRDIAGRLSVKMVIPAHCGAGNAPAFAKLVGGEFKAVPGGTMTIAPQDLEKSKSLQVVSLDH